MFTVCPKCALTLVVTAADLRVAQGYVRCGRCSNVFNAIVGLSDDRQAKAAQAAANAQRQATAAAPPPPAPARPAPPPPPDPEPETLQLTDDSATTGENEAIYAEPEPLDVISETALEFNPTRTDVSQVFIEPPAPAAGDRTGTFETIVLRADDDSNLLEEDVTPEAPPAPAPKEDEYVDHELRTLAAKIDAETTAAAPVARGAGRASSPASSGQSWRFVSESEQAPASAAPRSAPIPEIIESPPEPERTVMTYVWPAAAVVALLLLGLQAIHHYRHDLATDPRFTRTLTSLYGKLGIPLVPRWDLTSYEVRQLGASSGAGTQGQLLVRASLKNSATHPLPLPLLRVIVQDRYGNRIAARDVAPRAYAPGAVPEGAQLGAGQRLDTEMTFVDPGQQAVGFEIDACLPGPDNAIHCANDVVAAR
jgi:predicted Zn finger-like uncharacterized protein